jgi:replicative DNA helicase
MEIHAELRRSKSQADLGLVVVDYLQLMTSKGALRTATRRSARCRAA